VDAVLICADTASNEPLEVAGRVARDKGVVVAVGAVGMAVPRKVFFEKELDFKVSRSYGPGRYDPSYEELGHDYPIGFVRWTEQRNLETVIGLMADNRIDVAPLITHRFPIERAAEAFELVTGKTGGSYLAVLLEYPEATPDDRRVDLQPAAVARPGDTIALGVLGAGLFASATMLPVLKAQPGISLRAICSSSGLTAQAAAKKYGFAYASTDESQVIADRSINTLAVLTRHAAHARQVCEGLRAGKHVFVEKPLCVSEPELLEVSAVWAETRRQAAPPALMVGFNRRFAPFIVATANALQAVREPLLFQYRVNAGFIPQGHWTQEASEGGRLIGEGCHFIDLVTYLAGARPIRVSTKSLPDGGRYRRDNLLVTIEYDNGSLASVAYVAGGNKGAGKEMLEIHGGGLAARMDDFRTLTIHQPSGVLVTRKAWLRQDKGHRGEWRAFAGYLAGTGADPMPFDGIVASMRATLAAARSLDEGRPVEID
jgi:predicted dehydrogenase